MKKQRIISVVPSLTELVVELGLLDQLVGITRFCIHPKDQLRSTKKVGGTKTLKLDRIIELQPDLVIANKEENSKEDIEFLQKHVNVLLTDIYNLEDAYLAIQDIARATNTEDSAHRLISEIKNSFQSLTPSETKKKVAYLIWRDPIMLNGRQTFIQDMIQRLNWENVLTDPDSRYPSITEKELSELNPEYILLSSEPFPFKEKHIKEFEDKFPNSKAILVDGEYFSWYGSRLKAAPAYFNNLLKECS